MRSFTTLLLALSSPLYALADHDHPRRHTGLARRARGDVLDRRDFTGRFTYYDITVGTTACGGNYPASAFVVAQNGAQFGLSYPHPNCGKTIRITCNGKTTTAVIVDECPGCPPNGLDLTQGLFTFFADPSVGVLQGSWDYVDGSSDQPPPKKPEPKPTPTPTPTPKHEDPPAPKHTTSSSPPPPPPPPTTSTTSTTTSSKKKPPPTTSTTSTTTTSSTSTTPHKHSTTSSTSSSSVPTPTGGYGLGQPAGVTSPDEGTQNLEGLNNLIINYGGIVEACNNE